MLVLDVMLPTPLELSMLPSVRLRSRLTLLSFMEPTDMLDTHMLVPQAYPCPAYPCPAYP